MALFAGGALLAAAAVAATLRLLQRSLLALLTELCDGEQRARFWWRIVTVELATGTALCTSAATLSMGGGEEWRSVPAMVRGACLGLMVSVLAVIAAVLAFQRQVERRSHGPA